ncbi:T9SS type A sorting domain-containing protein [Psychroserpens algicola]|uniref:T9SS type A sorting domain-containing protein n=1 Tax=Psychroserpens algicola TaxID=1719034 RepID=UPI001953E7DB|nr:T9SS type A sorting domain-containing protein [Psychroserpens algicola]
MKSLTYLCLAILCCVSTNGMSKNFNDNSPTTNSQVQRVRLDITTAMGYTRHLLLGFTPDNAASDGFDYGYDAVNGDSYDNDSSWMVGEQRCVIQGVGAFHESKTYPLGLFLSDAGNIEFSLEALEYFDQDIQVYIYDALEDTVTSISDSNFTVQMPEGNYTNRFFVAFTNNVSVMVFANQQLSVSDAIKTTPKISYINSTQELQIIASQSLDIEEIKLYSILGQNLKQWSNVKPNLSGNYSLSLSNISKGTYIVSVKTKQGKFSKRLIISQ